jgi:DNA-binding transcriptional LysR family regulator
MMHLAALWPEYMAKHPRVGLDVTLSDRVVDLVEEGYDMAIRIAQLPSSSLISRKLASTRLVLCASPEYLRVHGTPIHPSDLSQCAVLSYSLLAMGDHWQFDGPEGQVSVKVSPSLRSNSGDTCREAAVRDRGVILQPTFLVGPDLESGKLVELMPTYRSSELGVYAVYPSRKFVSPKVRLLIDFLVTAFRDQRWPV